MAKKQWAEALPYAEVAAETWAQWAMLCAARCLEGLKDWEKAELWTRRATERYPNSSWSDWYRFCKRTGHGEVASARDWTEAHLASVEGRPDLADPRTTAYFYWSIHSLKKARDAFKRAIPLDPLDPSMTMHLALVADELGEAPRRDELFEVLWTKYQGQAPRTAQVCRAFREWFADGGKGDPDLAFVNRMIERLAPDRRGNLEFFVGRLLTTHGKPELARPYLQRSLGSENTDEWVRIIATDIVRPPGPEKEPSKSKAIDRG